MNAVGYAAGITGGYAGGNAQARHSSGNAHPTPPNKEGHLGLWLRAGYLFHPSHLSRRARNANGWMQ